MQFEFLESTRKYNEHWRIRLHTVKPVALHVQIY